MSNKEDISQLIESGFNINSKNDNGITLLHELTIEGDFKGVKSLLEHEADFNAVDKDDRNPLHYAVIHRHKKIAKLLISKLTINSKDQNGLTPLHLAVLQDDIEMMELLIENGAKINVHNLVEGHTPIHMAALYGSKKSVQILIDRGANLESYNNNSHTPLFALVFEYAAHCESRMEILEYLMKRGANVYAKDTEDNTLLFLAAYNNHMQVVKLIGKRLSNTKFIEFIMVKNKLGFDPLDCVIENGNEKMMEYLVSKGVKAKDHGMHKASYNGNLEAVKLLLKFKVNVNSLTKCGKASIHLAAKKGHIEVIKILLDSKVNINIRDSHGYTALHIAIQNYNFNIAQLLIVNGANINVKCNNNYTPIDLLIKQQFQESQKSFYRFLNFYFSEKHNKYKRRHVLLVLVLSMTIIGLPFVFKLTSKYRDKIKMYKEIREKLENLIVL